MKEKKKLIAGCALAAILLFGAGSGRALAYDLTVKNTTTGDASVTLFVRGPLAGYDKAFEMGSSRTVSPGGTLTFGFSPDRPGGFCASYLAGRAGGLKEIVAMSCDGLEGVKASRCCMDSSFEIYKKKDGTYHFQKK